MRQLELTHKTSLRFEIDRTPEEQMSTVEEAIEEEVLEPEIRDQHQPPRHAAEVGGVADAGGVGLTAGLVKSEEARRGVGTREKNRPGSPKRAAAIVRRQSVSKVGVSFSSLIHRGLMKYGVSVNNRARKVGKLWKLHSTLVRCLHIPI